MTKAPRRMHIVAGELKMLDGSDLKAYLTASAGRLNITRGEPVCVITSENLDRLISEANNWRLMQMAADERYALAA